MLDRAALKSLRPFDFVFHLAGVNGGIAWNKSLPSRIFYENTVMGLNLIDACAKNGVKKLVSIVASCSYPEIEVRAGWDITDSGNTYACVERKAKEVMYEGEFLNGPPHDSVACHGYAKRNLLLASQFAKAQYGLNAVCLCPTTLFGPNDSTNPQRTKVLMAIVKKVVDAKVHDVPGIQFWGTGAAYREFLYVKDAAELICKAAWRYDDTSVPLNLGTGQEFTIADLVQKVVKAVGYTGNIEWDNTNSDGQLRKRLDIKRMKQVVPEFTPTDFDKALEETIYWYKRKAYPNMQEG